MTRHDELVEQIFGAEDPRETVDRLRLRAVTDAELLAALTAAAAWSDDLADEYEAEDGDDALVDVHRAHAALCREAAAALLCQRRGG